MKKYNFALDGLRWFAFLGVFLFHANPIIFKYGSSGVQIFFVLSGFLIGRILLSMREDPQPLKEKLRLFYIRRSLRIFPLYYFVIITVFVLGSQGIFKQNLQHLFPFHALYLTNIYMFITDENIYSHSHFWSLDVEEHFYLLAPILLLTLPIKTIEKGIVWAIVLTALLRLGNQIYFQNPKFAFLSIAQFDILGIGVAAALIEKRGAFFRMNEEVLFKTGTACVCLILILILTSSINVPGSALIFSCLFPVSLAIASASFILALWRGRNSLINQLLSWRPFVYLGKISYGLYVYHNFTFVISRNSDSWHHVTLILIALIISIIIASLSWFLLENPINNLKRFFEYKTTGSG